jgi:UDP-N-acetylglucosamine--N-acetylmuramyl-(pentapeptide) pyrophosphoryl-undecaprenol N-acetylglucosamine transferase
MAREALRVVCYAVNGTGVGHVTRLLSIARWMRRYAAALEQRLEVWFLTSSEADGLVFAEGFAAFKIPSKTVVGETGIDRTAYRALAKQWIWHTLGLLRPDLLIVDTFPRGSFGELLGALDLCRHKAFVYRPVRPEVAARADFQSMLPLYDLILVPETDAHVIAPGSVKGHLVHVGPVLSRERWELFPRPEARARLGVDPEKKCVFVSAGGGGDTDAEAHLARTVQELSRDPSIEVVVGAGALYRGHPFPRLTTLSGPAAAYALGFDAAVCAAGYNTFGELMFAGVPTAFLPQAKLADDQRARAERAVTSGAASVLEPGADVLGVVKELLNRPGASAAARSLVPENGARLAAGELLRLLYPPAHVDRVEAALDDSVLASVAAEGARELDVVSLAGRLAHGCDGELGVAVERAGSLLSARGAREVRGVVDAIVRGLGASSVVARADVCDRVIEALGGLAAGDGAAARAAVAAQRWGGAGDRDGSSLARAMRG